MIKLWTIRSLRVRLLISLMLAIGLVWATWIGCQVVQMSRQQSGHWDTMMQSVGQQILRSVHASMGPADAGRSLQIPSQVPVREEHLSYQVWHRDGHVILRSVDAPEVPWVPVRFDVPDWLGKSEAGGQPWRVYTISDASGNVQVQVAKSQRTLDAELRAWFGGSLVVALLAMVLLGTVSWWTICWMLRPVLTVRRALDSRAALDLQPLPMAGLPQELRPLVEGFNQLLGQLDTALRGERRFLADAAHELRTPLAVLTTQARLVQSARTLEESRASAEPLLCGIERASRLTEQLLDSARLDASPSDTQPDVALHEIVEMVVQDFDASARQARQRLQLDAEACALPVDVDTLGVLLRNLLDNAQRYSGPGSRIQVACRRVPCGTGWCVELAVRDDGPGVPSGELARLFDRFYRVPGTPGRGSGIGLSLVARIAELHGAEVEAGTGLEGRGLGISLRFVRYAARPPAPRVDSAPMPLALNPTPVRGPATT